jgi:ferredoxin
VVKGRIGPDKCTAGGTPCAKRVAEILGIELDDSAPYRPVIHCAAKYDDRLLRSDYRGEPSCFAANVIGDVQGCTFGCTGFGDCAVACKYDAIHIIDGLAVIDYDKCIGCAACERACPRHIISMIPFKAEQMLVIACSNKDPGRLVTKVCTVGCLGCKLCQKLMDIFEVRDNLSALDYDKYQPGMDFSAPMEKCPRGVMISVGKPSAKDLAAVAAEQVPDVIRDQFKTTADDAEWRG